MMFSILKKEALCPEIYLMEIYAPHVAERYKAGQFVIIQVHKKGERIPLTVAESARDKGTIILVFQVVGKTTIQLSQLGEGDYLENCVGPLGNTTEIAKFGRVICVGGGTGIACILPIVRALKEAGNQVISVIGARTASWLILEDEIRSSSSKILITTDDGSKGHKGFVTDLLENYLRNQENLNKTKKVIAIGPPRMMMRVAEVTRPMGITTIASLNTIMVDGTGMCGSCRVFLGKVMKLACIDGPEFDAHQVNFNDVISRLEMFKQKEIMAMENYLRSLKKRSEQG
ncbi:MAG: sulfide/dihydroorotate dehydrogenase-like FAD/NAD-binding protein [Acidobacteriota bacterium]